MSYTYSPVANPAVRKPRLAIHALMCFRQAIIEWKGGRQLYNEHGVTDPVDDASSRERSSDKGRTSEGRGSRDGSKSNSIPSFSRARSTPSGSIALRNIWPVTGLDPVEAELSLE